MLETFVPLQIETSGASIHVMKAGSGEPLLLLHGYPQTHVVWHKSRLASPNHLPLCSPTCVGMAIAPSPKRNLITRLIQNE